MKRTLILAVSLLLTLLLTACGTNGNGIKPEARPAPFSSEEALSGEQGYASGTAASVPVQSVAPSSEEDWESEISFKESETMKMNVQVGDTVFSATLEKNMSAEAFAELMKGAPVTIEMSDYSGFEKVGDLGTSLPTDNSRITTGPGDIVLYNGNQIVIFYGTNSWSYTRLGKIHDLTGWEQALGTGDVTVTFSVD